MVVILFLLGAVLWVSRYNLKQQQQIQSLLLELKNLQLISLRLENICLQRNRLERSGQLFRYWNNWREKQLVLEGNTLLQKMETHPYFSISAWKANMQIKRKELEAIFDNDESLQWSNLEWLIEDIRMHRLLLVQLMDVVYKRNAKEWQATIILQYQMAFLCLGILLFCGWFLGRPVFLKLQREKREVLQIATQQSEIFEEHLRNIDRLRFALRYEEDVGMKNQIFRFMMEEIEGLEYVSKSWKQVLEQKSSAPFEKKTAPFPDFNAEL